jgi:hypothetical protein
MEQEMIELKPKMEQVDQNEGLDRGFGALSWMK